jgi:hypothetical protein
MAWPHRVHRLSCRVRAGGRDEAFAWRAELREAALGPWPALFGAALDAASERLALGERTLHLPRLELRLAAPDARALAEALPAALAAALARWDAPRDAEAPQAAPHPAPITAAGATSRETTEREALLHLLDHGRLPWEWAGLDGDAVLPRLRAAARRLLDEAAAAPVAWRAWAQAQPLRVLRWARWLDDEAIDAPDLAIDDAPIPSVVRSAETAAQRLWQRLLRAAAASQTAPATHKASHRDPPSMHAQAPPLRDGEPEARASALNPPSADLPRAPAHETDTAAPLLALATWQAADAGLVLLHPFLPRLFEACRLIAPNARRIEPEQQPHAAALLHWLATGRDEAHEHELTLAKLLLGVAPDAPLLPAPTVAPAWRDEGEALLAAAIAHWGALGSTGIEGLRASFLQRRGRLVREDAQWRLTVAHEAFDLLLARLPWALSLVRLPWGPEPIAVDWVA